MFIVSILVLSVFFVVPWFMQNRIAKTYQSFLTNKWLSTENTDWKEIAISILSALSFITSAEGGFFLLSKIYRLPSIPAGIVAIVIGAILNLGLTILLARDVRGKPTGEKRKLSTMLLLIVVAAGSFILSTYGIQSYLNGFSASINLPAISGNDLSWTGFYIIPFLLDFIPIIIALFFPVNEGIKKDFDPINGLLYIFQGFSFCSTSYGFWVILKGLSLPSSVVIAVSVAMGLVINLGIIVTTERAAEYAKNNPFGSLFKALTSGAFFLLIILSIFSWGSSIIGYGAFTNESQRNTIYSRFNGYNTASNGEVMRKKEEEFIRQPVNKQKELLYAIRSEVEATSPKTVDERRKGFELKLETIQKNLNDINQREGQINQDRSLFGQDPRVEQRAEDIRKERAAEKAKEQQILEQIQALNNSGEAGKMFFRDGDNEKYDQILSFYENHISPDYSTRSSHNYDFTNLKETFAKGTVLIAKYNPTVSQPVLTNESLILDLIKGQKDLTQFNVEKDSQFPIPGINAKFDMYGVFPIVLATIHDILIPFFVIVTAYSQSEKAKQIAQAAANRIQDKRDLEEKYKQEKQSNIARLRELNSKAFGLDGNGEQGVNYITDYIKAQIAFQIRWYRLWWILSFFAIIALTWFNRDIILKQLF